MTERRRTIPDVLRDTATNHGDRIAIIDDSVQLTFAELKTRADKLSKALIANGFEHGDRFAIWSPNLFEWVYAALAGQQVGGILVPVNTRFTGDEAGTIVRRSGARFAFTVDEFLGTEYAALLARQDCPALERVLCLRDAPHPGQSLEAFTDDGIGVTDNALSQRINAVGPDDPSDILYTSGTTGAPKGAVTNHGQNVAAFEAWSDAVGLSADDRYLIVNPFFHAFGYKAGWLSALLRGATIYPEPTFDVERVLRLIEQHRITLLPGPPTIFQSLLAHPTLEQSDLSSLRCAITGAASVPVQLVREMKHTLGFDQVCTGYGLTESSGVVSLTRPGDDFETIANSAGRAIQGVEIQITNPEGAALPAEESGEIWVRGYNVMQGYLDDPAATAATITEDGWLKTGDIGVLDERGYLRITDRLKDMYICGGFNCYPAEIENLLLNHTDVAEVAVIGTADDRLGEVGHAFVVRAPGHDPDPAELIAWAREHMANYKAPRKFTWIDELPRNASGKVQKFLLPED